MSAQRMGRRWTLVLAMVSVLWMCPPPPAPCPVLGAAELKIGYVDLSKVFDGYEKTKRADAGMEKKGKDKEAELQGRMNELKKLRQNLELLSDDTKEAKRLEIEGKEEELQRFRANSARDLRRERDTIARDILKEIQATVEEYAKANGFSLILDSRSILYGQPAFEATDGILKLLNSRMSQPKP